MTSLPHGDIIRAEASENWALVQVQRLLRGQTDTGSLGSTRNPGGLQFPASRHGKGAFTGRLFRDQTDFVAFILRIRQRWKLKMVRMKERDLRVVYKIKATAHGPYFHWTSKEAVRQSAKFRTFGNVHIGGSWRDKEQGKRGEARQAGGIRAGVAKTGLYTEELIKGRRLQKGQDEKAQQRSVGHC